jgi:uncharacterized membrane protein YeaQ/YmgE (transglycosylase-associated protein family)
VELLFAALGGAILGLAARYAVPGRSSHGAVLLPAIGTIVAMVLWVLLTWLGWAWNGGWIWWVTLIVAGGASVVAGVSLARSRATGDARMLHTLMRTGHPARS